MMGTENPINHRICLRTHDVDGGAGYLLLLKPHSHPIAKLTFSQEEQLIMIQAHKKNRNVKD